MLFFPAPHAHAATATEAWVQRYSFEGISSSDQARKVVTDSAGNVIVAGYTDENGPTGSDMLIIKYSGAGAPLWTNRYNGPASSQDATTALAVDGSGNVFVTGNSQGGGSSYDYATIAYSAAGLPLWTNRFNGPGNGNDNAQAVVVDDSGNVFVTGSSFVGPGNVSDYATIKYSGTGVPVWTNRHNGGPYGDFARSMVVDGAGNVFVTGYEQLSEFDPEFMPPIITSYATVAYSGAGALLWTRRYKHLGSGTDGATSVAVDGNGSVFVTGYSQGGGSSYDYATIAYSGAGLPLWTNRYNGPANSFDAPRAIAVDSSGSVFVTGLSTETGFNRDYATIAYSGGGAPLWTNRYNGVGNGSDEATAVTVDGSGNVLVTGHSAGSGTAVDYATIAYSGTGVALWTNRYSGPAFADASGTVAMDGSGNVFVTGWSGGGPSFDDWVTIAYSGTGLPLWTNRYDGPGNGTQEATAVTVDANGNVFVTGSSEGNIIPSLGSSGGRNDFTTIAYSTAGVALWTNRYNGTGNGNDDAQAVVVDGSGNVLVTGHSAGNRTSLDYATVKYSGSGVPLWTNRYDGIGSVGGTDYATGIAVDAADNVFVTGYSWRGPGSHDYLTLAYSAAGVPLWTNRYNGTGNGDDYAQALAVDSSGNVIITGSSFASGFHDDYITIAYSGAGVPLWTNRFSGPGTSNDRAQAIVVDGSGNVFVTGNSPTSGSGADYLTIGISSAGVPLWTNRYNGPQNTEDIAEAIAVERNGNVFVTGWSFGGGVNPDYVTVAYSGAGVPLWTSRYSGPENSDDRAYAVAADGSGNVIVTGSSNGDYVTIAYSGTGTLLWSNRYNGPANRADRPSGLAISTGGAVYVTGASEENSPRRYAYATVKYVASKLSIQPLTASSPSVTVELLAAPNSSWTIQRAVMPPGPWTNLGTIMTDTNGAGLFQDGPRPAGGAFYRARQP